MSFSPKLSPMPAVFEEPLWLRMVRLLRWHKPSGRLSVLLPGLWAAFLAAKGMPSSSAIAILILNSLATVTFGSVVNDLWDKDIDSQVKRTSNRPLASGALSVKVGLAAAIAAFLCGWVLALYLNPLSFWLWIAAVLVITLYPLAKRFFPIPQLILALVWGFLTLIGWSAVTGKLEPETWLLCAATMLFSFGFDTIYAIADREDDARLGIYSSPVFYGDRTPEAVVVAFMGTAILFAVLGWLYQLNVSFWLALISVSLIWFYQYRCLRQPNLDPQIYGKFFAQNVGIGFSILGGIVIGLLL
jgi:4-hydroxybenzoate polyprenyltransferase